MAIVLNTSSGDWIREGDFYSKIYNGEVTARLNGKYLTSPSDFEKAAGREIDYVARKLWEDYNGSNT